MFAKRKAVGGNKRKRQRPKSDDEDEGGTTEIIAGDLEKGRRKFDGGSASTKTKDKEITHEDSDGKALSGFTADRGMLVHDSGATKILETETDKTQDKRAQLERNKQIADDIDAGKLETGIYRGKDAYKEYMKTSKDKIAAGKYTGTKGPVRGNNFARMTARMDYAPDVCKDYKETGYCGWGDTCKFLHDRSDYKHGWQIDREYEAKQKRDEAKKIKALRRSMGEEVSSDSDADGSDSDNDDGIPFCCLICKTRWEDLVRTQPVVTICGHYFCEKCALEHYSKSGKCFACNAPTNGIFNAADIINDRLKKKALEVKTLEKKQAMDAFCVGCDDQTYEND